MGLPPERISLTPEEIGALNQKLSDVRHSINNHLTLVVTALELMRRKPDAIPRMLDTLVEQPQRIRDDILRFSLEFEHTLRITRD
jgi:hypothetical protein